MKRFISGFISGALIFGMIGAFAAATYVAEPANYEVIVDGEIFVSNPPAMNIEGNTYLPLRAMADVFDVEIGWDPAGRQVEIMSDAYLQKISVCNFIIGDVWNNGFWFLARYADGTVGEYIDEYNQVFGEEGNIQVDIGKVVQHIMSTKDAMELYNILYNANKNWQNLYYEYNLLYEIAASGRYTDMPIDTKMFESARDNFVRSILY